MAKARKGKTPPKNRPVASEGEEAARSPLWETLAMAAAFVLLWLWFGAHKSAQSSGASLAREWTVALLIALAAMAAITVRRARRFRRALEESQRAMRRGPTSPPWMPPDRNSHN